MMMMMMEDFGGKGEGLREGKESLEGDESERLSIFLPVKPDSVQTRSKPS
jgi:hypothetical protein